MVDFYESMRSSSQEFDKLSVERQRVVLKDMTVSANYMNRTIEEKPNDKS